MNLKRSIVFAIILLSCLSSYSQNFLEKQLPSPEKLSSFFIGPLIKSTIHYGEKPANYNGEVLVLNHGYIDLNQLFFTNNSFYEEAYTAGYQIVFVATTRGKGMWENGELLAESIDIITSKFFVNAVTLIAHSNGGKAAEVAMFSYDKKDKVKKVFALGTPFYGTYLADISQQWWFNWIWSKTGLNEGSATSTTYYCKNVVRPYFDNLETNQPSKFYILGGSGYKNGHTILAPLLFTSGTIVYVAEGINDGVTSYDSSLRPNANYLFKKGEAKLDHVDLAYGQFVWEYIKPHLNTSEAFKTEKKDIKLNPKQKIISNYQIINSENSYDDVIINNPLKTIELEVFHENQTDNFDLYFNDKKIKQKNTSNKSTTIAQHKSNYTITNTSTISLKGNSRFAAFAYFSDGPKMNYELENKQIDISFNDINTSLIKEIEVDAVITKTTDLYGEKSDGNSYVYPITYNNITSSFQLNINDFEEGIYSIYITGKNSNFVRSIATGFTIGNLSKNKIDRKTIIKESINVTLQTNIINDELIFIDDATNETKDYTVTIYNLNGQIQLKEHIGLLNGKYHLNENISSLKKGLYILILEKDNHKKSYKIIKN